jgi:hypothetical protein
MPPTDPTPKPQVVYLVQRRALPPPPCFSTRKAADDYAKMASKMAALVLGVLPPPEFGVAEVEVDGNITDLA